MSDLHCNPTYPVARKQHQCIACLAKIPVGEQYVQQEGFFQGEAYRNRYHAECWDILCDDGDFEFSPGDIEPPFRLTGKESQAMSNEQVFNGLYQCNFRPDQRTIELDKRLAKYYAHTPDSMGNRESYRLWRGFREWAKFCGYTSEEINKAKSRVQSLDDRPDKGGNMSNESRAKFEEWFMSVQIGFPETDWNEVSDRLFKKNPRVRTENNM